MKKANSSKIWPRCTAAHNSDRKVLSPWHYKVLKTSMHKGPIWECNLKFSFKLICFGTIHTLRQEKDWVSSKSGSFCFNVHCWKILLILSVTDLTKKLLCKLCKVASIGFYSPFHIAKWRVLGFTHHFTCFTWFFLPGCTFQQCIFCEIGNLSMMFRDAARVKNSGGQVVLWWA